MKRNRTARRFGFCALWGLIWPVSLQAQISISASDMFNQPGQYYRAYANATNNTSVSVSGMLGSAGGPQLWDFTSGPADIIYRFDYLAATNAPHSAAFVAAGARLAEQKMTESSASQAWFYFTQDAARGRLAYGFYDPEFSAGIGADDPQEVFSSVLNDFPATIRYGDAWSASTTFTNVITFGDPDDPMSFLSVDLLIEYSAADMVDAYGVASSPGIGFGDCLRINELATYVLSADFNDGSGFQHLETDYVRNYYWLRPGRGIVAQVTSQQTSGTPPDNNFLTATAVARMFETNHPDPVNPGTGGGIQGLKLTLGPSGALLQWTALSTVTSYRVEYTTNPGTGWQPVGNTTTGNFLIDTDAGKPNTPVRFYRVVCLP